MLLNTHEVIETMISKGIQKEHAEIIVKTINDRDNTLATKADIDNIKEQMATKSDIKDLKIDMANLRSELKSDISNLRSELKDDISDLKDDIAHFKSDIIKWIVGAQMSTLAIVIAIIAFLK